MLIICILIRRTSNDRLVSLLVGLQFTLEAAMTIILLLRREASTSHPLAESAAYLLTYLLTYLLRREASTSHPLAESAASALALLAMLAPIIQRLHDAVVVQICRIYRKEQACLTYLLTYVLTYLLRIYRKEQACM